MSRLISQVCLYRCGQSSSLITAHTFFLTAVKKQWIWDIQGQMCSESVLWPAGKMLKGVHLPPERWMSKLGHHCSKMCSCLWNQHFLAGKQKGRNRRKHTTTRMHCSRCLPRPHLLLSSQKCNQYCSGTANHNQHDFMFWATIYKAKYFVWRF